MWPTGPASKTAAMATEIIWEHKVLGERLKHFSESWQKKLKPWQLNLPIWKATYFKGAMQG